MNEQPLINPYHNLTFLDFILLFFKRLFYFFTGQITIDQLATDEIQVFVLSGVALSCALVGTFLILRRVTMLANSLSHTILIGIVIAYVFFQDGSNVSEKMEGLASMQSMIIASLIVGFLTAFLTEFLTKVGRLQEDASTGLVFTSLFAIGVILVTLLTRNSHIGIEAVMGNADALNSGDLFWVYVIFGVNLLVFFIFFKEYILTTFDSNLALALGISPIFFSYLLMSQVSVTTITAFRAVGVLLVLAFLTGPPLIARLCTHHLKILLILASFFGLFCVLIGVAVTRHVFTVYGVALSTSGVVVCVITLLYIFVIGMRLIGFQSDRVHVSPNLNTDKKDSFSRLNDG